MRLSPCGVNALEEVDDCRVLTRQRERGRLADNERADRIRPAAGSEQSDDTAVRVADEVCAVREQVGDVVGVAFEVAVAVRTVAVAAPVDDQQAAVLREDALLAPRLASGGEASVDEQDAVALVAPPCDVEVAHEGRPYNRRVDLDLVFLGTAGSMPTAQRAPAALLVRRGGDRLLFDCAEGTQRQLLRSSVGLVDLSEIFLTHFHADHVLGLPGMLKTFALRGREVPLTVYGPRGLNELLGSLRRVVGKLTYELRLVELAPGDALDRDGYRLATFDVHHGVSSLGWSVIELMRPGRFDVDAADSLGVPPVARGELQRGESITLEEGRTVTPDQVLGPARPGRKVVITGDTAPTDEIVEAAWEAEVLVTEATFADDDRERAAETLHQTASQAAEVAQRAQVGMLALTHLSNRYFGPEIAREARAVFTETVVPKDFDVIEVPFAERGSPQLIKGGAAYRRDPDPVSSGAQ